jgi:hypothetical protein
MDTSFWKGVSMKDNTVMRLTSVILVNIGAALLLISVGWLATLGIFVLLLGNNIGEFTKIHTKEDIKGNAAK